MAKYDIAVTGTGSDTLTFLSCEDPSYEALDDVSVTRSPSLTLSNGATATYTGISADGKTLNFSYQVAPNDDILRSRSTV